jgi:hypothetical protein
MSDPHHLYNNTIVDAVAMDGDITSDVQNLNETRSYCIQAVWYDGSTPIGNLIVQGSNDNSNFTDIVTASITGDTGSSLINVEQPAYGYVRVFYDRSSGDGTLDVTINGKY